MILCVGGAGVLMWIIAAAVMHAPPRGDSFVALRAAASKPAPTADPSHSAVRASPLEPKTASRVAPTVSTPPEPMRPSGIDRPPVRWAGDTPVISVTNFGIPLIGTYSARVVIYQGQYAGTWSGKTHGGHLFGKIVKNDEAPKEDDAK